MKRHILNILGAIIVIAGVVFIPITAAAQSSTCTDSSGSSPSVSDEIISGLWSGINLMFSSNKSSSSCSTNNSNNSSSTSTMPVTNSANNSSNSGQSSTTKTQPAVTTQGAYAALGDSVAAGVGLPNPVPVPAAETRCGRTREAYPYEVAAALKLPLVHIACSGATAGDLFTVQRSGSPNLPPQLQTAFASGTPSLITITAGANDAHWAQFARTCYFSNCATALQTTLADGFLAALQAKLLVLFPNIQAHSGGNPPQVIVTGYYNPISPACTRVTSNITPDEVTWMTAEVNSLNTTIKGVVDLYSFAHFVPVDFTGHDVCSSDPWVQGVSDPQPFHPTVEGQHVIARDILSSMGR